MWFSVTSTGKIHERDCRYAAFQNSRAEWKYGRPLSDLAIYSECQICEPFIGRYVPGMYDSWLVHATDPALGAVVGIIPIGVHPPGRCALSTCAVHNPSDHHMRDWKIVWRSDRQTVERVCPEHGCGHPDPDDFAFRNRDGDAEGIHGCCGCCHNGEGLGADRGVA